MNTPFRPFTSQAVHSCLRNRNWQLVNPANIKEWEKFLDSVADLLRESEETRSDPTRRLDRAVTGAYCAVLYEACVDSGAQRQHRAFREIWNWVYNYAYRSVNNHQDAEDIAQEAIEYVYQNLQDVSRPNGFLAWIGKIAYYRVHRFFDKKPGRRQPGLDLLAEEVEDESNPTGAGGGIDGGSFTLELAESEAEILKLLDDCIPRRAYLQKVIFIERGLRQRTVTEVAQRLGITATNVHTTWFRVLRTVAKCNELIDYLIVHVRPSQRSHYAGGLN